LVPSQPAPLLSPDGQWLWNGQQWSPNLIQAYGGRSKIAAGLLGILLGGLGIHKFYLGQVGIGILYLLFCWTFIPAIIGLIEGIIFLTLSDPEFEHRYGNSYLARQHPFF
jgi:hypothetical protein